MSLPGDAEKPAQHLVLHSRNDELLFAGPEDYLVFLHQLAHALRIYRCNLHAYVLMPTHVDLLVTNEARGFMQQAVLMIAHDYQSFFNRVYGRTQVLWDERYESTVFDQEEWILACYRYMELKPVLAGMVRNPVDYSWSSYRCNGLGVADPAVTPHSGYRRLGKTPAERQAAYRGLFEAVNVAGSGPLVPGVARQREIPGFAMLKKPRRLPTRLPAAGLPGSA